MNRVLHEVEPDEEHSEADEQEFIRAFEKAKEQGKARFTGVSSHGRPWLKRLCETYPEHFQVMLFPYTASSKELPTDSLFDAVRKHDIGTFGIKPFGSGSLFSGTQEQKERADYLDEHPEIRDELAQNSKELASLEKDVWNQIRPLWSRQATSNKKR